METLSEEELEAETIYKLAVLRLIDIDLAIYMAKHLEKRSCLGAEYLKFLIVNGVKLQSYVMRPLKLISF